MESAGDPAMKLRAQTFDPGQPIARRHTEDGEDRSPALRWSDVPPEARSLALIVDDPDAPQPEPFVHWLAWNLPPESGGLHEGVHESIGAPARQGRNSFSSVGWRGPAPPVGHGVHHYHFRLYALDAELSVPAGASRDQLERAMSGHVVDQCELVGTYQR
jgi:Raf kinase inhibitor-like YbhB/YbcL family protein